jgi:ATP-binding cassette subfamily B protein
VGQRQLLSFARALAADPDILVLDEATSNVDTETEIWIQEAVEKLMKVRTSIVIAHRLSTIRTADKILVLHRGRVCEEGNHQELLDNGGIYSKLHELQYSVPA